MEHYQNNLILDLEIFWRDCKKKIGFCEFKNFIRSRRHDV